MITFVLIQISVQFGTCAPCIALGCSVLHCTAVCTAVCAALCTEITEITTHYRLQQQARCRTIMHVEYNVCLYICVFLYLYLLYTILYSIFALYTEDSTNSSGAESDHDLVLWIAQYTVLYCILPYNIE